MPPVLSAGPAYVTVGSPASTSELCVHTDWPKLSNTSSLYDLAEEYAFQLNVGVAETWSMASAPGEVSAIAPVTLNDGCVPCSWPPETVMWEIWVPEMPRSG